MAVVKTRRALLVATSVVIVLSARLCYLVIRFGGTGSTVRRPHIESAALLLAVAGLIVRFATDRPSSIIASRGEPLLIPWPALAVGALALYWPALHLGLLSDDFILVDHARAWDLSQVAPQLFRPLPLLAWTLVLHSGGGATTLHLLNILLHATNAYLAGRLVAGWVGGRWWPSLATFVVLAAPLGPEAVAWCSGVFDLSATLWILCALLVARRAGASVRDRALLVGAVIAALLSKETAVVLPLLLVIDALVTRAQVRTAIINIVMVSAIAVVFGAVRFQSATPVETSVSRYRVQRLVFDSFGALAAPWHVNDPWLFTLRAAYACCAIALVLAFFVNRGPRRASAAVLGGAAWVLASILPLLAFFYVGSQLEGSRYLYLAACGWSAVLVAAAADVGSRGTRAARLTGGVLVVLIAAGVWGVRQHLQPWSHAATVRDQVLSVAATDERLRHCSVAYVEGLPDSMDGAYLFANGAREALADAGVTAFVRAGSGECAFRWEPGSSRFVTASAPGR